MTETHRFPQSHTDDATLAREARRILRRLSETGAVLAVVPDMEKAVVARETADGSTQRMAVVETEIAQALALKEWIVCKTTGRIARYQITAAGRAELGRLLAQEESQILQKRTATGMAEAQTPFAPVESALRANPVPKPRRRIRYSTAETPLAALARRRDKSGAPFLEDTLVAAGERLREDFELSQMEPRVAQNWDAFLTGGVDLSGGTSDGASAPMAARDRVARALRDLGPGLGDVALRCCCYLEGLESAEQRLGWSARSGKIVLRIALQRLARFYDLAAGEGSMIG